MKADLVMRKLAIWFFATFLFLHSSPRNGANEFQVSEDQERIVISSPTLEAAFRKKGYVTGVAAGSFLDKKSGFRDAGYGLDIVDWIMEPGSDEAYRDQLKGDLPYVFNNSYHGKTPKRSIEGPQICTKAGELFPKVIVGKNKDKNGGDGGQEFVAVSQDYTYRLAALGKKAGSRWEQTIVFPAGERYFDVGTVDGYRAAIDALRPPLVRSA